jgi:hypothetical protein
VRTSLLVHGYQRDKPAPLLSGTHSRYLPETNFAVGIRLTMLYCICAQALIFVINILPKDYMTTIVGEIGKLLAIFTF